MKRFSSLLLMALLMLLPSFAAAGGPRLALEAWSHDAGEVREGIVIEHVLKVYNQGDQFLHIKDVNSD
jgi:hypothetical protein